MRILAIPGTAFVPALILPTGGMLALPIDSYIHPIWLELACYLGKDLRTDWLTSSDHIVQEEIARYPDAVTFYRESDVYLYHLNGYFLEGYKRPAYAWLLQGTANTRCRLLDYGCGTGNDGLWFLDAGYDVSFADVPSKSLTYLRWRLHQRGYLGIAIHELPAPISQHYDAVWCMDVLEHLPPAEHLLLIETLARLGTFILVNLVDDHQADGVLHHPVDVEGITAYIQERWISMYQDFYVTDHGKVRLLCYGDQIPSAFLHRQTFRDKGSQQRHEEGG